MPSRAGYSEIKADIVTGSGDPNDEYSAESRDPAQSHFSRLEKGNHGLSQKIIDFCVPVNSNFPPPELLQQIEENLAEIVKYYPDYSECLQENLALLSGMPAINIIPVNGSTELINILIREAQGPMVSPIPTFGCWTDLSNLIGKLFV